MPGDLPDHYFRVRENGAAVFRVDTENRARRMELIEIATVNIRNGSVKPHGDVVLTDADTAAIQVWMAARLEVLGARDVDDIHRAVDHLNLTTQWVQSRASEAELEQITDALLLAMHDLRSVLVRKKADRIGKDAKLD
jgi:ribosome-interacting GTPase 1